MSAMVQQTPVTLRTSTQQQQDQHHTKKTDDAALATYLTSKLRIDQQPQQDAWAYPQPMVAMMPGAGADWSSSSSSSSSSHHYVPAAATPSNNAYYYYGNTAAAPYAYNDNKQPPSSSRTRPSPRPRTPSETSSIHSAAAAAVVGSGGIQVQKSCSTPNRQYNSNRPNRSSQLLKQQQQQHYAAGRRERQKQQQHQMQQMPSDRPPSLSSTASSVPSPAPSLDSGRRSSITSVSSGTFSIRSEMSVNTKLSLSKRLRKVFSMSHLRPSKDGSSSNLGMIPSRNGSNTSLATVHETGSTAAATTPRPARRRSFASLFQKNQEHHSDRPALRVDTTDAAIRRSLLKGDSPTSTHRPKSNRKMETTALPSPTPSATSSSSSSQQQQQQQQLGMAPPPAVGMHYGLPLHGSPRLRPAATSSTSSINTMTNTSSLAEHPQQRRRLQFCPTIQVHETFAAAEYDRRCDSNATCQKMTPLMAMKIKQELNEFKLTDMEVHVDSRQYTHFFL